MIKASTVTVLMAALVALLVTLGPGQSASGQADPAPPGNGIDMTASAKTLFGSERDASKQPAEPLGNYSKGCLAGGVRLPESGPTWQAMRLSRNRNWGHPETIGFIKRLSAAAARQPGWNGLYVGDISQPRGGPVTGHRSHQIGMDVDVWMRPANDLTLTLQERENIASVSMRRSGGAYVNDNWTRAHHEILKAAAMDTMVARIFVFPGAKVRMCNDETGNRTWLRKIRPWWGHHFHFHVRLNCPAGASNCVEQPPPPPGDGCEAAENWVYDILNPKPPDPDAPPPAPRPEITMADLPHLCARVLSAQ